MTCCAVLLNSILIFQMQQEQRQIKQFAKTFAKPTVLKMLFKRI